MPNVIRLNGIWTEGYAFDQYVLLSRYISDDPFGHAVFDTTYTGIGELLHSMKYNGRVNTSMEIASRCKNFLERWLSDKHIDEILPVPPTLEREFQPVYLIAEAIHLELQIPYTTEVLEKTSMAQAKNMPRGGKNLSGTIRKLKDAKRECNILLIDDLYSTGSTASECVAVLKQDPLIQNVYFFAIAKTRSK